MTRVSFWKYCIEQFVGSHVNSLNSLIHSSPIYNFYIFSISVSANNKVHRLRKYREPSLLKTSSSRQSFEDDVFVAVKRDDVQPVTDDDLDFLLFRMERLSINKSEEKFVIALSNDDDDEDDIENEDGKEVNVEKEVNYEKEEKNSVVEKENKRKHQEEKVVKGEDDHEGDVDLSNIEDIIAYTSRYDLLSLDDDVFEDSESEEEVDDEEGYQGESIGDDLLNQLQEMMDKNIQFMENGFSEN